MTARLAAAALALVLAAAAGAEEAGAAPGLRIALDPLRAGGVDPALARAVEERVCAALAEHAGGAEVVCPSDVEAAALLARHAMVLGECRSDDCLGRVDAVRAADRRVTATLERGEGGLVLSLRLAGPEAAGPRVSGKLPDGVEAALARVPAIVRKLFP